MKNIEEKQRDRQVDCLLNRFNFHKKIRFPIPDGVYAELFVRSVCVGLCERCGQRHLCGEYGPPHLAAHRQSHHCLRGELLVFPSRLLQGAF